MMGGGCLDMIAACPVVRARIYQERNSVLRGLVRAPAGSVVCMLGLPVLQCLKLLHACTGSGSAETGKFSSGSVGGIQGGQPTAVQGEPALKQVIDLVSWAPLCIN